MINQCNYKYYMDKKKFIIYIKLSISKNVFYLSILMIKKNCINNFINNYIYKKFKRLLTYSHIIY